MTVIVDRRKQERRDTARPSGGIRREVRDRRRPRIAGDHPPLSVT